MEEAKRIYNHCRACHLNCATYATVRNGRLERIDAVPPEEGGTGKVCARAIAGPQLAYSPTRVRYPLRRAGKRGEGKWERVSWDQAVAEIARKVYDLSNEHGPETFVLPGRTGRHDMGWIAHRIARTIGTPNNYYGAIQVCFLPQFHEQITFGSYLAQNVGTAPSELFVTFGIETNYCWPVLAGAGSAAKTAGMKHIALDPVAGPHALKADEWLPIRPGTDLAYCLCVIRHLLRTGQYRDDFVRAWTNAPFLVREDTGGLLRESDVKRGGKADRYLFWDEASDSLRFWDAGEVQWEGGVLRARGAHGPLPRHPARGRAPCPVWHVPREGGPLRRGRGLQAGLPSARRQRGGLDARAHRRRHRGRRRADRAHGGDDRRRRPG